MDEIIIDEEQFESAADVHAYLAKHLDFPDYYGNNLDALNDCLGDLTEGAELVIYLAAQVPYRGEGEYDQSASGAEFAAWFPKFVRAVLRAAQDNEDLVVNVFAPNFQACTRLLDYPGIPELLQRNVLRSELLISTP